MSRQAFEGRSSQGMRSPCSTAHEATQAACQARRVVALAAAPAPAVRVRPAAAAVHPSVDDTLAVPAVKLATAVVAAVPPRLVAAAVAHQAAAAAAAARCVLLWWHSRDITTPGHLEAHVAVSAIGLSACTPGGGCSLLAIGNSGPSPLLAGGCRACGGGGCNDVGGCCAGCRGACEPGGGMVPG
jgi:hypothetical protein